MAKGLNMVDVDTTDGIFRMNQHLARTILKFGLDRDKPLYITAFDIDPYTTFLLWKQKQQIKAFCRNLFAIDSSPVLVASTKTHFICGHRSSHEASRIKIQIISILEYCVHERNSVLMGKVLALVHNQSQMKIFPTLAEH